MLPFSFRILAAVSGLLTQALPAFQLRSYNAASHDRFTGTIAAPVKNPNQLYAAIDLTGVGWRAGVSDIECSLVSRQHVVFATHFTGELQNQTILFLNGSNQIVNRSAPTKTTIMDGGNPSDLAILTLDAPIDASEGVQPLPYLDLASEALYVGKTIGVVGQGPLQNQIPVIGRDTIDSVEATSQSLDYGGSVGVLTSRLMRFDYLPAGSADEGVFEVGDSGSPTFVQTNGRAALVGTHSFFNLVDGPGPNDYTQNYDVFVPHYITQLDAAMAPLGYRMRPVNAPATTLSGATSIVQPTPRRLHPLTLEFGLNNTGANLTGNLEVEFHFPPGQAPDTVSAAGWVTYGSGTKWTLRKATMAAAASATLTASWTQAPALASVSPTIVWRSDTVADQTASPVIALAPSYAEWAVGLSMAGETDDPDNDGVVNLLEYSFGGDGASGVLATANGVPQVPTLSHDGAVAVLKFPERADAAARGLTYTIWYSTGLDNWTTTAPAGTTTSTAPYAPPVSGFVERSFTWPDAGAKRFVRVAVTLNE